MCSSNDACAFFCCFFFFNHSWCLTINMTPWMFIVFFMFSFRSILDGIQYLVKCLFFLVSEFFGLYFCVNKLLFLKLDSGASSHQPAGHPASWTWDLPGWLKGRFLFFFFFIYHYTSKQSCSVEMHHGAPVSFLCKFALTSISLFEQYLLLCKCAARVHACVRACVRAQSSESQCTEGTCTPSCII